MKLTAFVICAAILLPIGAVHAIPAAMAGGRFTPEERFLYMQQQRGTEWRGLSQAQRCERVRQMRHAQQTMTPVAMQRLKQKLDAEWKALPPAEQKRIEQRIAEREARRADNLGRRGRQGRCARAGEKGRTPL